MGWWSDRRALRDYRNGVLTYSQMADIVGLPRIEQIPSSYAAVTDGTLTTGSSTGAHVEMTANGMTAYDAADNVDKSSPLTVSADPNWRPDWRPDWYVTALDADLYEVLWGSNCTRSRIAHQTAERVIECGWANEHVAPDALGHLLWNRDLREKKEAILTAGLIEALGWSRPEPEPAEAILYTRDSFVAAMKWLGREEPPTGWGSLGDQSAFILRAEESILGCPVAVFADHSVLRRVGGLVEVLTTRDPVGTVLDEPVEDEVSKGPGSGIGALSDLVDGEAIARSVTSALAPLIAASTRSAPPRRPSAR
jgi:hypothetical protein